MTHSKNAKVIKTIKLYREAICNGDIDDLDKFKNFSIFRKYLDHCQCGCAETPSVWSTLSNGAGGHIECVIHMIENGSIYDENVVQLLAEWYGLSGTYLGMGPKLMNPMIHALHNYVMAHPKYYAIMIDYRHRGHDNNASLLHRVFYGYDNNETISSWVKDLLSIGCDPFVETTLTDAHQKDGAIHGQSVFMLMVWRSHVEFVEEYAPRFNVNAHNSDQGKYDKGRTLLMRNLKRYKTCKDREQIDKIARVCRALLDNGYDLTTLDADGRNINDYLIDYQWGDTAVSAVFDKYKLPDPTGNKEQDRYIIYKNFNPSPFCEWLYQHRWTKKITDDHCAELKQMVEEYGLPDMEVQYICEGCDKEHHRSCKNHKKVQTMSQLMHQWDFRWTPIKDILMPDESDDEDATDDE